MIKLEMIKCDKKYPTGFELRIVLNFSIYRTNFSDYTYTLNPRKWMFYPNIRFEAMKTKLKMTVMYEYSMDYGIK